MIQELKCDKSIAILLKKTAVIFGNRSDECFEMPSDQTHAIIALRIQLRDVAFAPFELSSDSKFSEWMFWTCK
jgi:hypothetical protein